MPDTQSAELDVLQQLKQQMQQKDVPESDTPSVDQDPDAPPDELDRLLRAQLARMEQDKSEKSASIPDKVPLAKPAAEASPEACEPVPPPADSFAVESIGSEGTPDGSQTTLVEPETVPAGAEVSLVEPETISAEDNAAPIDPEAISLQPCARDDELNGVPVSELLNSGAFFQGLDPEVSREIQSIWDSAAPTSSAAQAQPLSDTPPAESETVQNYTNTESTAQASSTETPPAAVECVEAAPTPTHPASSEGPAGARNIPSGRKNLIPPNPLQIGLDSVGRGTSPENKSGGSMGHRVSSPSDRAHSATPRHTYTVRPSAPYNHPGHRKPGTSSRSQTSPARSDAELYMDLGYETELRRTPGGSARADAVLHDRLRRERIGTRNTVAAAYENEEYSGAAMTQRVERRYEIAIRNAWIRLISAGIGCLAGIVYDALLRLGSLGMAFSTPGIAYPLISIGILILFSLPSLHRAWLGLRSLWDFEPVRYAVPGMALSVSILHALLSLAAVGSQQLVPLFTGAPLLLLSLTCLCDLLAIRTEWLSFRIVSSGRARMTITVLASPGRQTDNRTDDLTLSDLELFDETEPQAGKALHRRKRTPLTLRLCRTARVPNFFALANRYNANLTYLNYLLPAAMLAAIVVGGVSLLRNENLLTDALPRFTATYLACLPGALLLSLILPFATVNRLLCRDGCAILGEDTPREYAPASLIGNRSVKRSVGTMHTNLILPDGFALSPVLPNEVTLRNDTRADEWLNIAHRLFALFDCPLAGFGEPPSRAELDRLRLELAENGEEFLRLYLTDPWAGEAEGCRTGRSGGTFEIMLGSRESLAAHGIRLPAECNEESYKKTSDSQILYVAIDRHFRLACACALQIQPLFQQMAARLRSCGCHISLLSYIPLTASSPLFANTAEDAPHIGLCRPRSFSRLYAPRSGGLVSTRDGLDILRGYFACRRIRRADQLGILLGWLWMLAACGLSVALPFLGVPAGVLPLACSLWHIATVCLSCLPTWFSVRSIMSDSNET